MRNLITLFLALAMLAVCNSAFAVTVDRKNVCANTTVPTGWVIANKSWNKAACGNPTTPTGNVWLLDEYDNLPVGTPLTICASASSIPKGWVPTNLTWNNSLCGAQYGQDSGPYNTETIRYAVCSNESSKLCYPSAAQFAVISALPTSVPVLYGQSNASTEIGWFASQSVCIWVQTVGVGTQLWTCDGSYGVKTWPYVDAGVTQVFIASPSSVAPSPVLASVQIRGAEGPPPHVYAAPSTVTVPTGASDGSTTISYNLIGTDYPSMCIWVSNNGAAAQLWACGTSQTFAQVWPYVPKGGTSLFWLNPSSTSSSQILATVVVTGK